MSVIRELDDVVREAKRKKEDIHIARVHGICVEKNHQLPKGDPRRKFKGRGVLSGQPSEESIQGSRILSRSRQFTCVIRSVKMGGFLWMSSRT